jgi:hypothetical protein
MILGLSLGPPEESNSTEVLVTIVTKASTRLTRIQGIASPQVCAVSKANEQIVRKDEQIAILRVELLIRYAHLKLCSLP